MGGNPPDSVQRTLEFGLEGLLDGNPYRIEKRENSDIEGVSIITGSSGNVMSERVKDFLVKNTTEDYLLTCVHVDRGDWASMAIPFETREDAKEFRRLVRECGGSLRLSSGENHGWYFFEAE